MSFCRGDQRYSTVKLWQETQFNQVTMLNIRDLAYVFDFPVWREGTPKQVMRGAVPDMESHRDRVAAADVSFPIIISHFVLDSVNEHYTRIYLKNGKYDILDGVHRLCKQVKNKSPFIFVTLATKQQIEAARID